MIASATATRSRARPSAIRDAGAAATHRHRARRASTALARRAMAARPCVGGAAARRRDRALAGAPDGARLRRAADSALASVAVIEAANAEEEALAIAVALREAMTTARRKARPQALVTPDRALARRVLAALARWNVPVDDSGGDALGRHAGRRVRAARRRGRAWRGRAGDAAGAAQASAVQLGRDDQAALCGDRLWSARSCAARGHARHAGLAHALQTFRDEHEGLASQRSSHCIE